MCSTIAHDCDRTRFVPPRSSDTILQDAQSLRGHDDEPLLQALRPYQESITAQFLFTGVFVVRLPSNALRFGVYGCCDIVYLVGPTRLGPAVLYDGRHGIEKARTFVRSHGELLALTAHRLSHAQRLQSGQGLGDHWHNSPIGC